MKYIVLSVLALLTCISFQSCSEDDIMFYEGGNAVHFLSTSQEKSFALEPDAETAIMQIPVQLVGNLPEKDLTFSVEVIDDGEYTTATPEQYNIVSCIVPAGETKGFLSIEVSNPDMLNLDTKNLYLRLKLIDNDEVKAGGWRDYLEIDLKWSSDWVKPDTWSAMRWYIPANYKHWSPNLYRAYIAATGLTEFYGPHSGIPDPETGAIWTSDKMYSIGKKLGDWIRKWNEEHYPEVYCHDGDEEWAGTPIEPKW